MTRAFEDKEVYQALELSENVNNWIGRGAWGSAKCLVPRQQG